MSEERNKKKYPEAIVGALIINREGQILLCKGKKWGGRYSVPGGHVELGENLDQAIKREVKEETNLDVEIITELGFYESIDSKEFYENRHFVFLDYLCRYDGDGELVKMGKEFDGGWKWVTVNDAKKINGTHGVKHIIEEYEKYLKEKNALDGWKRCQADFENYKKDQTKRMEEFRKFASLDMVLQILPVLDNFEKSLEHIPEDQKESAWVKGVNLILKQLVDVLKSYGVEEIGAKEGDDFNPEVHEAVQSADTAKKTDKADKISKVLQKGYKMDPARNASPARSDTASSGEHSDAGGGKVIRAARVIVN